ncbi:hypothetical protein [Streptomyces sp. NPDC127595]|uniref:hypothetical protein n=1 Tax=Streptomyces sp. NPDC127595 TaxID=3345405 RepID=UPI00363D8349
MSQESLSRRSMLRLGGTAVAAAGLASLTSPATALGSGTTDLPAGSTFMAWKGVTGDQQVWWNSLQNGGNGWSAPQPVPGASSSAGVALAGQGGGPLFMTWKGVSGDERIWWNWFDGTTWSGAQPVPGALSSVGPALAPYAGVFMAWKGSSGDQRIWWNSYYGGWTAPQAVPGASSSFGPALTVRKIGYGEPYMAWKGVEGDQAVWWNKYQGGSTGQNTWTVPQTIPGAATSAGVALAAPPGGGVHLAWKGIAGDQRIWWSQTYPSSPDVWRTPQVVPYATTDVGPALAVYGSSTYMTWRETQSEQVLWSLFNGSGWTTPRSVSGAATSFRPALAALGS